jgi:hypothetical protein
MRLEATIAAGEARQARHGEVWRGAAGLRWAGHGKAG